MKSISFPEYRIKIPLICATLLLFLNSCGADLDPANYQPVDPSFVHQYIVEPINIHKVDNEKKAKDILKEIDNRKISMTGEVYKVFGYRSDPGKHIVIKSNKIDPDYPNSSYHRTSVDYNFFLMEGSDISKGDVVTLCGQINDANAPIESAPYGLGKYTNLEIDIYNAFICDKAD
jgi:hypothetical protein